jgi:hypothetical protein
VLAGRFRLRRADGTEVPAARRGRASAQRLVLVVTRGGAVVVARLTRFAGSQVVQRFDTAASIGVTAVGPGDSYVEVAGRRYWVHGVWTYGLYTLHARRGRSHRAPPLRHDDAAVWSGAVQTGPPAGFRPWRWPPRRGRRSAVRSGARPRGCW